MGQDTQTLRDKTTKIYFVDKQKPPVKYIEYMIPTISYVYITRLNLVRFSLTTSTKVYHGCYLKLFFFFCCHTHTSIKTTLKPATTTKRIESQYLIGYYWGKIRSRRASLKYWLVTRHPSFTNSGVTFNTARETRKCTISSRLPL